jgi:putative transposase
VPAFTKCYFHAVWAVKHRAPLLIPAVETVVLASIQRKAETLKCRVFALNGALDHIHLALEIPASLAPAHVIGTLKGATSHEINEMGITEERFNWQDGYGLITFGPRALADVVEYVENQKERHKLNHLSQGLERIE